MGTDAYMHLESRKHSDREWTGCRVASSRNYKLFDALAGGSSGTGFLYPPRGLPKDVSDSVLKHACSRVTDNDDEANRSTHSDFAIKRTKCMRPPFGETILRNQVEYYYCWYGYWHSYTWLTPDELEASLSNAKLDLATQGPDFVSVFQQMRDLESTHDVRLVMWFDQGPVSNHAGLAIDQIGSALQRHWSPLEFTNAHLQITRDGCSALSQRISETICPAYEILRTSKSMEDLVNLLGETETEVLQVVRSPTKQLQRVAAQLLQLDLFPEKPKDCS